LGRKHRLTYAHSSRTNIHQRLCSSDSNADTHTNTYANTNSHTNIYPDTNTYAYSFTDPTTHSNTNTDTHTYASSNSVTDANTYSNARPYTYIITDTHTNPNTSADFKTSTYAFTDPTTHSNTDPSFKQPRPLQPFMVHVQLDALQHVVLLLPLKSKISFLFLYKTRPFYLKSSGKIFILNLVFLQPNFRLFASAMKLAICYLAMVELTPDVFRSCML
jgi:hypothetical protein